MSFAVGWDFPARVGFHDIPWPASADVDAAIFRFARERAPALKSGAYRIRVSAYLVSLRVDRNAGTVLVLFVHRAL